MPNDEAKLRALITKLKSMIPSLRAVDQPATVGTLPVAVARDEGVLVANLPGLAMRCIADLHAGERRRQMRAMPTSLLRLLELPHTLHSRRLAGHDVAADHVRIGSSGDALATEAFWLAARTRSSFTTDHRVSHGSSLATTPHPLRSEEVCSRACVLHPTVWSSVVDVYAADPQECRRLSMK